MYLNVISFKNGRDAVFQSEVPYSVDQINNGWNIVSDESNGQILNFRGEDIITVSTAEIPVSAGKGKQGKMEIGITKA